MTTLLSPVLPAAAWLVMLVFVTEMHRVTLDVLGPRNGIGWAPTWVATITTMLLAPAL